MGIFFFFFFSSRRRHTSLTCDWSSDVCSSDLAMPGSSNFVGEFLILLGVFKSKLAIAVIAFSGVVGAAVYALRIFITSMQNRIGADVNSREIEWREAVGVVPLVA